MIQFDIVSCHQAKKAILVDLKTLDPTGWNSTFPQLAKASYKDLIEKFPFDIYAIQAYYLVLLQSSSGKTFERRSPWASNFQSWKFLVNITFQLLELVSVGSVFFLL